MTHIRNREELIDYVEKHCKRKAVVRAIQEGSIECLGAFKNLGPDLRSGWILRVSNGSTYTVEVVELPSERRYAIYVSKKLVPWPDWLGDWRLPDKLWSGDKPERYKQLKQEYRYYA